MKEFECNECYSKFYEPTHPGSLGLASCPECGSSAIFPTHSGEKTVARSPKERKRKRGKQIELFGKEA